jgi:hypothetical protein
MKAYVPLAVLAFIGTVQAQVMQPQPSRAVARNGDAGVQSVPARPAAAPRTTRARTNAPADAGAPLPTFLDRSKQEYFDQIPLFRDAPTFRDSPTQSTVPSTTEGLAEALGLVAR